MRRNLAMSLTLVIASVLVILAALPAPGQQKPMAERKILLRQDLPMPGYEVVQALGIIQPGGREGKHTHPGMMVAYVLEGAVTMAIEGGPTVTYKAGDSYVIQPGVVHEGINNGKVEYKGEVTYIVEKGKPLTSQVP
jgi:quercetin dioxygenase-like cupin family protein